MVTMTEARRAFLPRADLDRLLALLTADGRRIIGPTVSQGAIVYDLSLIHISEPTRPY